MKKTLWHRFLVGFFNGIVILLPVIVTVFIIRFLVLKLNDVVLDPFVRLFTAGRMDIQHIYFAKTLVLLMVISGVTVIGWAARVLFINRVFSWGEKLLIKVPMMGRMYNVIKQISSAFLGQGKTIFKQVVMIEYPRKGIYSIGFTTGVTRGEMKAVIGKSGINVFLPTTPNPTSGMFLVVPREEIRFLRMSVEDGMKLIVSGGSITPLYDEEKENS